MKTDNFKACKIPPMPPVSHPWSGIVRVTVAYCEYDKNNQWKAP